jgi:hypothetical protein
MPGRQPTLLARTTIAPRAATSTHAKVSAAILFDRRRFAEIAVLEMAWQGGEPEAGVRHAGELHGVISE